MNPVELMLLVIREHTPETIWTDAPLEPFRRVANTNRGDIGEDFVQRYLQRHGIVANRVGSRISAADLEIGGKLFEVKTASEDKGGAFQFNHVRLDRTYDYLFCLGFGPMPSSSMHGARGQCLKAPLEHSSAWPRVRASRSS